MALSVVQMGQTVRQTQVTGIEYYDAVNRIRPRGPASDYMESLNYDASEYMQREKLVRKYAWAIPTEEALETIAKYAPIVEMGAGAGYWAYELRRRGVEVLAYDKIPPDGREWPRRPDGTKAYISDVVDVNWWHEGYPSWTEVLVGTPRTLSEIDPSYNLFLCWPPYEDPLASDSLDHHQGDYLIFVGEGDGGCTADERFFDLLDKSYSIVEEVPLPQWFGIHDYLTVYARNSGVSVG